MITKFSSARDKYLALFEEATKRLEYLNINKTEELKYQYPSVMVESLEEYFSHLYDLVYGNENSPADIKPLEGYRFLKLPADEPHFKIDANSRAIEVPDEFKKNGVSVLGDEISEILFFEVDRFYDANDLSLTKIAIQWKSPGNPEGEIQYTPAFAPMVVSDDVRGDDKLIFGWPISSNITNSAGELVFSVRFYIEDIDDANTAHPIFSLSTLTQSVTINPGLVYNLVGLSSDQRMDLILQKRLHNSPMGEVDDPKIPVPIFKACGEKAMDENNRIYYQFYDENGIINDYSLIDYQIPEDTMLAVLGYKSDSGTLTYSWRYKESKNSDEVINLTDYTSPLIDGFYVPIKNRILQDGTGAYVATYFYKEYYGDYCKVILDTDEDFTNALDTYGTLYVRCSGYILTKSDIRPGEYSVSIRNSLYNKSEDSKEMVIWTVKGADIPIITSVSWEDDEKVLEETDEWTLSFEGSGYESSSISWEVKGADDTDFKHLDNSDKLVLSGDSFKQGHYRLVLTNERNNDVQKAYSEEVFVITPITPFLASKSLSDNKCSISLTIPQTPDERKLEEFENISFQWYINEVLQSEKSSILTVPTGTSLNDIRAIVTVAKGKQSLVSNC